MLKTRQLAFFFALSLLLPLNPPFTSVIQAAEAHMPYAHQTLIVENAQQLLNAIGSNRTIILKPNTYLLDKAANNIKNPHVIYDRDTGGPVIQNVHNLKLIGSDVRASKLVISSEFPNVLSFKNSSAIHIRSLEIGHVPQSAAICLGAVLAFENSHSIELTDLNLFGSGTFGLWLENSHHLTLSNSVIKECSQGIAFLSQSTHVLMKNSIFVNNTGGLNLWDASEARLSGITMAHNQAELSQDYNKALFYAQGKSRIHVAGSVIQYNSGSRLSETKDSQIVFQRNYMNYNRYLKP